MDITLYWILGVIIFLLVITISVALHEAGHMFTAKALKIPVPKYFVGFGPTLWSKKKGETEYGVKAIPLGGFILVEDTTQPEKSPERGLLSYVAPWKRILIFLAGPAVNLVLGIAIIFSVLMATPYSFITTTIDGINTCTSASANCAAQQAGFKNGDKVIAVDGKKITNFEEMRGKFKQEGSSVTVERQGKPVNLKVKANDKGTIGISMALGERERTAGESADLIGQLFVKNAETLAQIPAQVPKLVSAITGQQDRDTEGVASVIGAGKAYGETTETRTLTTEDKVRSLAMYSGLLNIGLGLINLLPLLPLDGGRIFIAMLDSAKIRLDKLRKKQYVPTDYRWVQTMTYVTGVMVLGFMALVIVADVVAPMPKLY